MQLRKKNPNQNAARHVPKIPRRTRSDGTTGAPDRGSGVVWAEGGAFDASFIDSLPCHDRFGRRFVWAASPHSSALLLGGGEEVRTGRTTEPTGPKPWRQRTEEYGTITYHCCTWGLVGSRTTDNLIGWQSTSLTQPFSKSETEVRASQWRWRSNEAKFGATESARGRECHSRNMNEDRQLKVDIFSSNNKQ